MESMPLVLTDPNMLAEFVRQSQLKTFFEKRFAAPEDLGAVLFRDGAVIDGFKGTQFSVGGFWENLKGVIGGSHHYEILLADLKPFQAVIAVKGMSKDHVEIVGEATFELQLNPDKVTSVLGLMRGITRNETDGEAKGAGGQPSRKALTVPDVVARLEPHFRERIFGADLIRHNAEELRGSRGLQDQIQADMMKEAERLLGDVGIMVRNSTVNFAMNEVERQEFERARVERDEKMKDYQLDLLKRQVTREADSTSFQINTKVDVATVQRAGEDELRNLVLNSEVSFVDAREAHKRRQEFEALSHEAKILLAENEAKTTIALGEIEDAIAKTSATHNLRKVEFDLTTFENQFRRQEIALETDFSRIEDARQRGHDRSQGVADSQFGLDTTKIDTAARGISHNEDHRQAGDWQKLALDNLANLNRLEVEKESGLADVDIKKVQADSRSYVDKMLAAGSLTPEQLTQVMPGMSASAAEVAIARAQAESMNAAEMIQLARDMTAESREQEHRMFETGMKGGTGMAVGLGGAGDVPASMGGEPAAPETVECPECKTINPVKAKFCKSCATQLRT